jgi:hypothetical protein
LLKLVVAEREITAINTRFRNLLRDGAEQVSTTLGMQGGSGPSLLYWHPTVPVWGCFEKRHNRYWNVFGLADPTDFVAQAPVCEINPRLKGIDQQVGGAYAIDIESGATYVLHNGKIGGGKKGIGKTVFWKTYGTQRPQVEIEHDGKTLKYAVVLNLDDADALQHLGRFAFVVDQIKNQRPLRKADLDKFGSTTPTQERTPFFLIWAASGDASIANLAKSIEKPLSRARLAATHPSFKLDLSGGTSNDATWAWGLRAGGGNDRTWERLRSGDEVGLFTGDELRYRATIVQKLDAKEIADDIWGPDEDGRSFEHVMFLSEPAPISVPRDLFNDLLSYEFDRSPQGTFILDPERALKLRRQIDRVSSTSIDSVSDLITVALQANPESGEEFLGELLFGEHTAPAFKPFDEDSFAEDTPWDIRAGHADYKAMLKKLERRSRAHNKIVYSLADKYRNEGRKVQFSNYVDLLLDKNVVIEVKTISAKPVNQVRAALAQLYHYRFAYRQALPNAKLVAVFSRNLDDSNSGLREFLNDCGVGTAWFNGVDLHADELATNFLKT